MMRSRLIWPAGFLAVLLVGNMIFTSNFYKIEVKNGHLYGSLIDILHDVAPLMLVAVGMTLVIATRGIDLSVGAVMAISGAMACWYIVRQPDQNTYGAMIVAVLLGLALCVALGAWNGFLVARIGVQPIVATLVLLVAGRGIAQLITNGFIINVSRDSPYAAIGTGHFLGLPIPAWIAAAIVVIAIVLTRRTALGMLLESVGGNTEASRLVGIRSRVLIIMVYVVAAFCAGIAGFIFSGNVASADGNNAGLWMELDAILAVVIGGTSLAGGRFYLTGTVLGALIIQTLNSTIYTAGIKPEATLVFKALVIMIVCLIQSPAFRARVFRSKPPRPPVPTPSAPISAPATEEVPA